MENIKEAEQPDDCAQTACCVPSVRSILNRAQAEQAATLFAALGDPTRLSILNLIAESPQAVCVCDITASFKLAQPTISHHLRILKEAGLVTGEKRGKWVYYAFVEHRTGSIKALLDTLLGRRAVNLS